MPSKSQINLETRVRKAAEVALAHHQYVSAVDIFLGMGLLLSTQVEDWRRGRTLYLERVIIAGLGKISRIMKAFRSWAIRSHLNPRETIYVAWTKGPKRILQFSKTNNPDIEKAYRTHFVSPLLTEIKQKRKATQKNMEHTL